MAAYLRRVRAAGVVLLLIVVGDRDSQVALDRSHGVVVEVALRGHKALPHNPGCRATAASEKASAPLHPRRAFEQQRKKGAQDSAEDERDDGSEREDPASAVPRRTLSVPGHGIALAARA